MASRQEIHFFTGKGGVGKSTLAASFAEKKAREGKKTLLVELGDSSYYQYFFQIPEVSFDPSPISHSQFRSQSGPQPPSYLWLSKWNGPSCLKDYILHLVHSKVLVDLFWKNQVSHSLLEVAPGLSELAVLGKITSRPRQHGPPLEFDTLVVDGFSTGHFRALLQAPEGLSQSIRSGPIHDQSLSIRYTLQDSSITNFHLVSLASESSLQELMELVTFLNQYGGFIARIWLNKVWPIPQNFEKTHLFDPENFKTFFQHKKNQQDTVRAKLKGLNLPLSEIPMVFEKSPWDFLSAINIDTTDHGGSG